MGVKRTSRGSGGGCKLCHRTYEDASRAGPRRLLGELAGDVRGWFDIYCQATSSAAMVSASEVSSGSEIKECVEAAPEELLLLAFFDAEEAASSLLVPSEVREGDRMLPPSLFFALCCASARS